MKPHIEMLPEKKLAGKSIRTTLAHNRTLELWQSFMPKRKIIKNRIGTDLYSVQDYDKLMDYTDFRPNMEFTKWAAIEVTDFKNIPDGLETFLLPGGLYAVFVHKGLPNEFQKTLHLIFDDWLPHSEYELDDRPHFEILGKKYINNHPDSEEEVWIPIWNKQSLRST